MCVLSKIATTIFSHERFDRLQTSTNVTSILFIIIEPLDAVIHGIERKATFLLARILLRRFQLLARQSHFVAASLQTERKITIVSILYFIEG